MAQNELPTRTGTGRQRETLRSYREKTQGLFSEDDASELERNCPDCLRHSYETLQGQSNPLLAVIDNLSQQQGVPESQRKQMREQAAQYAVDMHQFEWNLIGPSLIYPSTRVPMSRFDEEFDRQWKTISSEREKRMTSLLSTHTPGGVGGGDSPFLKAARGISAAMRDFDRQDALYWRNSANHNMLDEAGIDFNRGVLLTTGDHYDPRLAQAFDTAAENAVSRVARDPRHGEIMQRLEGVVRRDHDGIHAAAAQTFRARPFGGGMDAAAFAEGMSALNRTDRELRPIREEVRQDPRYAAARQALMTELRQELKNAGLSEDDINRVILPSDEDVPGKTAPTRTGPAPADNDAPSSRERLGTFVPPTFAGGGPTVRNGARKR